MLKNRLKTISLNPPLILMVGFVVIILLGAIILNTPFVTRSGESIGFINAIFTSASATCVTGLTVVNTLEHWNTLGHVTILILIQIGGLGVMTMTSVIPMTLSRRIGLTSRQILREELNLESYSGVVELLKYVVYIALGLEAIGALIMSTRLVPEFGLIKGIWYSVFHSVSAFCNAGFDIMGNSVVDYRNSLPINISIMMLIIVGGLGFQVIIELLDRKGLKRLSVHAKLVLIVTFILLMLGTVGFWVLEKNNPSTIGTERLHHQILQSSFQSVVTRTAGFNSVDLSAITDSSSVLFIILMFIGGSPGSTAGGLKTTTVGVLWAATLSAIKGDERIVIFNKKIPWLIVLKSLALVSVSLLLIVGLSFLLSITENQTYMDIVFELTSAYGTVGMSRGITPELSDIGKMVVAVTMFLGRIGPLTLGYSISKRMRKSKLDYPKANITVG